MCYNFDDSQLNTGMVEALTAKVQNWEDERGVEFMYDGNCLLTMLEDYTLSRQEKEQERKRQREQKKLQGQLGASQDSKPSTLKSTKKASRVHVGGGNNRGLSNGGNFPQTPRPDSTQSTRATSNSRPIRKDDRTGAQSPVRRAQGIVRNYTFNGRESEPTVLRRPCSPITSTSSSRANADQFDDQNTAHADMMQKPLPKNETSQEKVTRSTTTSFPLSQTDEEKPTSPQPLRADTSAEEVTAEEGEYSFEETRAGIGGSGRRARSYSRP